MKKLLIVLLSICTLPLFAQISGWTNKGTYYEQQLKRKNLDTLHFNESGDIFYTLHGGNTIYYWSTLTGKLIDSLVIPDTNVIVNFSIDGRSINYYKRMTNEPTFSFKAYITVIDLTTKEKISQSALYIPGGIDYSKSSSGWIDFERACTILDYNYKENTLICGITFRYISNFNVGTATYHYYTSMGGASYFEVRSDSLVKKRQFSNGITFDWINTNNSDYMSIMTKEIQDGGSASLSGQQTEYKFKLRKYDTILKIAKDIISSFYGEYSGWEQGKGEHRDTVGLYRPYSSLYFNEPENILYMKADSLYYIVNTITDEVTDSIRMMTNKGYDKITNDYSDILYYYNNKIFRQNIITKLVWDSLDCPINVKAIELSPNGKEFIVASSSGDILLYSLGTSADSLNLTPLTDMGHTSYKDFPGGLYPDGMNTMPAAHNEAGIEQMKQVVPLDTSGKLDQQNGKVVMLSIGMSNATQEFSNFKSTVDTSSLKNPRLVLVDGAQGGQTAAVIQDPDANFWNVVNQRLANAGVRNNQVQAVWLKEADAGPKNDFPVHAQTLSSEMVKICQNIKSKFPNARLCYVSSRTYGGYATSNLNPEPMAFESGFAVKWLIQSQIEGDTNLTFIGNNPKSPWLSWGPYLWANGTKPRAGDGLTWLIDDFVASDRTHPSESGRMKVANLLLDFFVNDETTKYWFTNVFTSVNGDDKSFEITLSPNPASDFIVISGFNLPFNSLVEDRIRIYNALGEIVLNVGAIHELPQRIDVSSLPPGFYFVRVGDKANKFVKI